MPAEMRVFYWTLRALLSHWRRHPVQFFSVLTGLWLATALLTGVQALNSQARDSYARASQLIGGEPQASLSAPDAGSFPQALFAQLRRAGWPDPGQPRNASGPAARVCATDRARGPPGPVRGTVPQMLWK